MIAVLVGVGTVAVMAVLLVAVGAYRLARHLRNRRH